MAAAKSHAESLMNMGLSFAHRAVTLDSAKDYGEAIVGYEKALQIWAEGIEAAGKEPDGADLIRQMQKHRMNVGTRLNVVRQEIQRRAAGGYHQQPQSQNPAPPPQSKGMFGSLFSRAPKPKPSPKTSYAPDPTLVALGRTLSEEDEPIYRPSSEFQTTRRGPPPDMAVIQQILSQTPSLNPQASTQQGSGQVAAAESQEDRLMKKLQPQPQPQPHQKEHQQEKQQPQQQSQRQQQQKKQQQQQPQQQQQQQKSTRADLLKRHELKLVEAVLNDVIPPGETGITWADITGLETSKQHLQEAVVLPLKRPDLFSGLREPPKGVLLFGPPGNGKTLLAKAVANESGATFFSISASSLVSRYLGDGEKMVACLFDCAAEVAPSVVFMDEVDSILGARGADEHDAMRRLKTEVLVRMDGVGTQAGKRLLVLAATNRPQDIDTACLRRFTKRILIPLPDRAAREAHIMSLCRKGDFDVGKGLKDVLGRTDTYSFSDLTAAVKEAAMMPLRELGAKAIDIEAANIRKPNAKDLLAAVDIIRPSAGSSELRVLDDWAKQYGTR